MDKYFLKAFINDNYIGLNGIHKVIEHFSRDQQTINTLIYTIIKACKSIEEWTLIIRLKTKSSFKYGLSKSDIEMLQEQQKIELLQEYCNIYVLLYHFAKLTLDKEDLAYKEHINKDLLLREREEVIEYVTRANKEISDCWNRTIF